MEKEAQEKAQKAIEEINKIINENGLRLNVHTTHQVIISPPEPKEAIKSPFAANE